jgi:hypothetical protein
MRKIGPHSRPDKLQIVDGRLAEAKLMARVRQDLTRHLGGKPLTAAAGEAVAPSKAEAAIVPIKPAKDIKLPGGNIVSPGIDHRTGKPLVNVVVGPPNGAKVMGGSNWPMFNEVLLETVLATIPTNNPDTLPNRIVAASAALAAFRPTDEVEAMLAAQTVGLHHGSMECLRRSLLPGQDPEVASKLRKDAASLARAMADMLDALDRKRGKGPQVVRVERVVVHEGGQAIVGNVQPAVSKVGEGQG